MKNYTFILFLIISNFIYSQDWIDSKQFSGSGNILGVAVNSDSHASSYIIGQFDNDITNGDENFITFGNKDIYFQKIDSAGNKIFFKRFGSDQIDLPKDFAIDSNDDLYILGETKGDCKFDLDTVFNTGDYDVFLVKYSSNGSLIWTKNFASGIDLQRSSAISIDKDNNVVISGFYRGKTYFNSNQDSLNSGSVINIFYSKLNSDGDIIWLDSVATNNNASKFYSVTSSNDAYYFAGYNKDTVHLDIGDIGNDGTVADAFLYKTDYNGNGQWVRKTVGTANDYFTSIDYNFENDQVVMLGYYFSNDMIIDSTATLVTSTPLPNRGGCDFINLTYDVNGNLQALDTYGSAGNDYSYKLNVGNNIVISCGRMSELLPPVSPEYRDMNRTLNDDPFILISDGSLNHIDTISFESSLNGFMRDAEIDNDYNYFFSGDFTSDSLFIVSQTDSTINYDTLINNNVGSSDAMFLKFGCRPDIYPIFTVDTITCPNLSDGNASVLITNGTDTISDNWTYLWSNTETTDTILNIPEDTYIVTVTSPKGCEYIDSVFVTNYPVLQTNLIDTITVDCEASNDGVAIVTPSLGYQGTTGYTYSWDTGETDSTATQLTIGTHYVTVQDACGSITEVIDTINVGHLPTLQAHIQTQNVIVLCDTSSNGIGRVVYSDGKAPYSFYWENSSTDTTSEVANDLTVGWHNVTITDYCNVPIIDSVNIVNLPTIGAQITFSQNASCVGTNNGVATVTAFNGIEPYNFVWSASTDTTHSVNDLPGDSLIFVTVSDVCHEVKDSVLIGVNPLLEVGFTNVTNTNCANTNDGGAEVILLNEQGTVTYLWSNDSTEALNTALNSGYAYVTVTDICGPIVDSVFIDIEPSLSVLATSQDNACFGDSLASISLTTSNEFGTVEYIWSGLNDTTSTIDSLASGTYLYTVTDACNDTIRDSVVVISPEELKDSVIIINETSYGEADGSATLIITGGTSPYSVSWDNGNVGISNEYLTVGTYQYSIIDANNCELSDSVVIEADEYDVIIYNAFTPNGDGTNDVWNIKNIDKFPEATVKIFNQWGAEVFSSTDGYAEPWDGTMDGNELPAGTYYYIITLGGDNQDKSGSVSIIK